MGKTIKLLVFIPIVVSPSLLLISCHKNNDRDEILKMIYDLKYSLIHVNQNTNYDFIDWILNNKLSEKNLKFNTNRTKLKKQINDLIIQLENTFSLNENLKELRQKIKTIKELIKERK